MKAFLAKLGGVLLVLVWSIAPAQAIEIKRVETPLGIVAWLVEDHAVPVISMEFAFRESGGALDLEEKAGLSQFAAATIDEGAADLDSQAFQGALADNAISLRFTARLDSFDGELRTLTENADLAFDLLRKALTEPRFDAEPVDRIRAQLKARLARNATNPDSIAGRTLWNNLFADHPYGRDREGTPETIEAITVDDLQSVVARLSRERLVIGVAGDITAERLAELLDQTFGGLPEKTELPKISETETAEGPRVIVVDSPVPQSRVTFAQPGPMRHDPDFYAAYVMNFILGGGGFGSRLVETVREERGLVYSVYSYLAPMKHASAIAGGLGTANGSVAEAIELVRAEWNRMAREGPSQEELDKAKAYLTGAYPLRFTSTGGIAGQLLGVQLNDLGMDYIDNRNSIIEAVTLEDVRRVAAKWLSADKLTVVVVGQPVGITATDEG